jgi:hypothetical protein
VRLPGTIANVGAVSLGATMWRKEGQDVPESCFDVIEIDVIQQFIFFEC